MKKIKRITAALLSVGVLASAAALTACNKKGDDAGQPAKTTVENAEEWKAAFANIFKVDSFTGKSYMNIKNQTTDAETTHSSTCELNIDFKNGRLLNNAEFPAGDGIHKNTYVEYDEIVGDNVYGYSKWNDWEFGEQGSSGKYVETVEAGKKELDIDTPEEHRALFTDKTETEMAEYSEFIFNETTISYNLLVIQFCTAETTGTAKSLSEHFSEFTYENGVYVCDTLGLYGPDYGGFAPFHLEAEIKDGIISRLEYSYEETQESVVVSGKVGFTIEDVNSTTVTLPDGARAAIDAEKAKG